jgi:dethiobiotin synthetase
LQLPVLLVAGSYLGAISHTLTAVTALKMRGVPIHKIVISESEESPMPLEETTETIERFCGLKPAIIYRNKDFQFSLFEK